LAEIRGVDVASFQHPGGAAIDWKAVKAAGYDRAVIKATDGADYVNPFFVTDVLAARAAGLLVAPYHFARMTLPVGREVEWFLAHAGPLDLLPGLDVEVMGGMSFGQVAAWTSTALQMISLERVGCDLYLNRSFRDQLAQFGSPWGHPLWLAEGGADDPAAIEQIGQESVPGIVGPVDVDVWSEGACSVQIPVLSEGHTGGPVKSLQGLLNAKSPEHPLTVDGVFGPATTTKVVSWQRFFGLTEDPPGTAAAQTWSTLLAL
jgi:lysozyme